MLEDQLAQPLVKSFLRKAQHRCDRRRMFRLGGILFRYDPVLRGSISKLQEASM